MANIRILAEKKVNVVAGTTGWTEQAEAQAVVEEQGIGCLWSPNFAIGVNLFWQLAEEAAKRMNQFPQFDVALHEWHHAGKKDSPSGTGLRAAELVLAQLDHKDTLVTDRLDRLPEPNELHVSSTRVGSISGTHQVTFDGPFDTLDIKHTSRSSAAFASGAVLVGEWLQGKQGWFTMDQFLSDYTPSS